MDKQHINDFYPTLKNFMKNISNYLSAIIQRHPVVINFIAGMFLALSMPGFDMGFIAWIGLIPLISTIIQNKSYKSALFCSFAFGLGFNLLSLSWLLDLHSLWWLGFTNFKSFILTRMIWLYMATYASFFIALTGLLINFISRRNIPVPLKTILMPFIWVITVNKLTSFGDLAFPWTMIEYSQYSNLPLIQFAQYIGGIGLEFFIVIVNAAIAFVIVEFIHKNIGYKPALIKITAIFTVIFIIHGAGMTIYTFNNKPDKVLTATVIQGNVTVEQEKLGTLPLNKVENMFLKEIKEAPPGVVVVPETAFFDLIRYNNVNLYHNLDNIAKSDNKTLIIGTIDAYRNKNTLFPTNAAIVFDKKTPSHNNIYDKQYLVPFGEYTPFERFIPEWLKRFSSANADFIPGNKVKVFNTSHGKIAPSICYEVIFPKIAKSQTKNNANILVGLSNLSWFRDSIIKDQFVAFSVMRAAETRKPLILSVNTGCSVIIDFTGKILVKLPKNSFYSFSTKLGYVNEKSFFSKAIF